MLRQPPRDPKKVASFGELRMYYAQLWAELDDCKRMKSAVDNTLKDRTKEVRGTKAYL